MWFKKKLFLCLKKTIESVSCEMRVHSLCPHSVAGPPQRRSDLHVCLRREPSVDGCLGSPDPARLDGLPSSSTSPSRAPRR